MAAKPSRHFVRVLNPDRAAARKKTTIPPSTPAHQDVHHDAHQDVHEDDHQNVHNRGHPLSVCNGDLYDGLSSSRETVPLKAVFFSFQNPHPGEEDCCSYVR